MSSLEDQFLRECLRDVKHATIVDIGAGSGYWEPLLCENSNYVVATEQDPLAMELLSNVKRGGLPFEPVLVHKSSQAIPLADHSVDCVVCIESQASDQLWFPVECRRILKPAGMALITLNNRASYKGLLARGRGSERYYPSPLAEAKHRWHRAGFALARARGYNWVPFSRDSDSRYLPLFAALEKVLGLRYFIRFSPWLMLQFRITG